MSETYVEYSFTVLPREPGSEILIAQLGELGFESFVETDDGFKAYIQETEWSEEMLNEVQLLSSEEFKIRYSFKSIPQQNWNARWEENFDPIEVDNRCLVRAPFHPSKGLEYEIEIEPKMSFGTGHHETTFMMLQFLLENDLDQKTVLDMGCGTAVLAILTEMRGASEILAVDIDTWSYENSLENAGRNNCENIEVMLGDASVLPSVDTFDVVVANINRNILLKDLGAYVKCLRKGGDIYLSGFYKQDLPIIIDACTKLGLEFVENKTNNNWVAAKFVN